jgi:hypothetical protein
MATLKVGEFEPLCGELADIGTYLNTAAPDEHVGDIERYMCTIKEHVRATCNTLPIQTSTTLHDF